MKSFAPRARAKQMTIFRQFLARARGARTEEVSRIYMPVKLTSIRFVDVILVVLIRVVLVFVLVLSLVPVLVLVVAVAVVCFFSCLWLLLSWWASSWLCSDCCCCCCC